MKRWRFHLAAAVVVAPMLVVTLLNLREWGTWPIVAVFALAIASFMIAAEFLYRRTGHQLDVIVDALNASSGEDARWIVHDMKKNSDLCREDRDRMALLLEDLSSSIGEGLLVVGEDLRVRLISPVAMRFCGVEEVRTDSHLLEVLRDPEVVEVIRAAAQGELPRPAVMENPRGLWEVRAFPIRGGGAVALASDVSVIRRASEFRRRFVQDLSHEIRSPLAVLRTTVEALEDDVDPRLSGIVVRQIERLTRLTDELYELATIESGQLELKLENVELDGLIKEIRTDFGPEADRREVELRVRIPEGLQVTCDRRGLYRVMSNLVDNAIKYNRRGGWLEIAAEVGDDGVLLTVSDSGSGIPASELQAVFQRFYRLDRARTPGEGGLGLGLAIVKHMVRYMGGRLQIDSREEVGTKVSILLPADPSTRPTADDKERVPQDPLPFSEGE